MNAIYIIILIFAFLMLFSGIVALKLPRKWENRDNSMDYPGYLWGKAQESKELWDKAQHWQGTHSIIMGVIQLLLAIPEMHLLNYVCNTIWTKEDATLPFILIIALPAFILIGLSYLWTWFQLKTIQRNGLLD